MGLIDFSGNIIINWLMHKRKALHGINHIDNAERNRLVLLASAREHGNLSRTELSRISGLSLATTKRLVEELLGQGLLDEGERPFGRFGRGRKPSVLDLGKRGGYAIGLDLEPESLVVTGLGLNGEALYRKALRPETRGITGMEELLVAEARKAIGFCSSEGRGALLGVGAGIAGLVDARTGKVLFCPGLPGWENVDLGDLLHKELGTDIIVDDGVRCMALAEKRYGSARGLDTFLYIYIGLGVGSGIILDNRIYRGKNGVSGEFGHITVREDGPLCSCGNRGCLEAMTSTRAILARTGELLSADVHSSLRRTAASGELTLADINTAAIAGDKLAAMVIDETEESLGLGIASLINIFDPGTVILAGEVVELLEKYILEGVQKVVRLRSLHTISQRTEIRKGAFDVGTASIGAATMILERFLENEILNL